MTQIKTERPDPRLHVTTDLWTLKTSANIHTCVCHALTPERVRGQVLCDRWCMRNHIAAPSMKRKGRFCSTLKAVSGVLTTCSASKRWLCTVVCVTVSLINRRNPIRTRVYYFMRAGNQHLCHHSEVLWKL